MSRDDVSLIAPALATENHLWVSMTKATCVFNESRRRHLAESASKRFKGIPKSPEQREKMRAAALARYAKPGEKERTADAVKKALHGVDRSGANNSHFGKPTTEAAKQKMRDRIIERGGISGRNNPNWRHGRYCR